MSSDAVLTGRGGIGRDMYEFPIWVWAAFPVFSLCFALGIVWLIGVQRPANSMFAKTAPPMSSGAVHFLFDQDSLTDHDLPPDSAPFKAGDWCEMRNWLLFRFSGLPDTTDALPNGPSVFPAAGDPADPAQLVCTKTGDATRVVLQDPKTLDALERHERLRLRSEGRNWGACLDNATCGVVMTARDGQILWTNSTFDALKINVPSNAIPDVSALPDDGTPTTERRCIDNGQSSTWLETRSVPVKAGTIHYVADVTKVVTAENLRREFVQTLTKTFANLTTGLAIFNRDKQLALFNPALVDLTGLGPDFLSGRPNLMGFFDNLRDNHVLPEPRNYGDWRTQILQMIETATDGLYRETWTLPSGLTYRVTGRPHPDGAVAFLFEDVSDEISLTRHFRSQVDVRQAVLDNLSEAVVVLSPAKTVLLCNSTCSDFLNIDPDSSFAEMSLNDLTQVCNARLPKPEFWAGVAQALDDRRLANPIAEHLLDTENRWYHCRAAPLPGGAAMLTIAPASAKADATHTHAIAGD